MKDTRSPLTVALRPVWRFRNADDRELDMTLLELLDAIERTGKLTAAARIAGLSHRHAWNLIEKWTAFLGAPLVAIERGRGTQLSALGAKVLWAGKLAQARLEPELENLAAEMASTLMDPAREAAPTLRIRASHDFCLPVLRELAYRSNKLSVDLRFRGSAESLDTLRRGACDLAGFHVTEGPLGRGPALLYTQALGGVHHLIRVATRVQGLLVRQGNPAGVRQPADLARPGLRFINRQRDSGTRLLLDQLLQAAGIEPARIQGYENEEYTHAAVAAHIASGLADTGLGIEAAAVQFGLDFMPLATEHYYFAVHKDTLQRSELQYLLGLLRGNAFHDTVVGYHGERAHRTGEVASIESTPPWNELLQKTPEL
jgi:molybdate transport repressor ModE-like protein